MPLKNNELGHVITHPTMFKHFKRIVTDIGRPDLRFHDLRHSYASFAADSGIPAATLSKNLGHSTTSFTMMYYVHATNEGDIFSANVTESIIKRATGNKD